MRQLKTTTGPLRSYAELGRFCCLLTGTNSLKWQHFIWKKDPTIFACDMGKKLLEMLGN